MKLHILPVRRLAARRQRGVTLIEALVAMMVMGFGMVALVSLMTNLRRSGDLGKQRSEAMRMAQVEMAKLRSFSLLTKTNADDSDYDTDIVSHTSPQQTPTDSNTAYLLSRTVVDSVDDPTQPPPLKTVQVAVTWKDRSSPADGNAAEPLQQIVLTSLMARVDPVFAGSVSITPAPGLVRHPGNRNPVIPVEARKLNDKVSIFRPSTLSTTLWVFNNVTGVITATCALPENTLFSAVTAEQIEACHNDTVGYLLSGTVRFSNTDPANPTTPEAAAFPFSVDIVSGTYQTARLDAYGFPVKDASGHVIMDTVTAVPPSKQCFSDFPTTSTGNPTFVNYYCIVYPSTDSPRVWSGKVTLTDFTTGTTSAEHRVCRYSADYNGNGSSLVGSTTEIDNYEHPAVYVKVTGSLSRQNFLVVRGDRSCPAAPAVDPDNGVFVDYSTLQLQPQVQARP